ncbi:MFS transporter [Paenibacillus daejeonensis]|uniref:MFS transporter n=1 Tax=Paenibacillus daejeonensis TaxID=135193 RepID=UPI00037F4E02|nr:MFS transporter [Paenibacillus daejeonensis]
MGITRHQFMLVVAVAFGTLLNPLNTTMIAVAFSRLQEDFQVTYESISWLIASFYLASAISQPIFGKLADRYGPKRIFMIGLVLVAGASALSPLSPTFGWLIGFRVVQSLGSAALFPAGMSIIRSSVTDNQARVLGVLSIFSSTSAGLGPSLGGVLIHYGDWPLIFLINFPFILLSVILGWRVMPRDRQQDRGQRQPLDIPGMVWFGLLITVGIVFLLTLQRGPYYFLLAAAVLLIIGFYRYEGGRAHPFIDMRFLKSNPEVCVVYVQFILVNSVFYSVMFSLPSYLQEVRQFDSQTVGIVMLSVAGLGIVIAPLAGLWIDRAGSRLPLLVGTFSLIGGSALMLSLSGDTSALWIFFVLSMVGFSNGFQNIGLQTALYSLVSKRETGLASGLFMTSRFLGTLLSSALLGLVFSAGMTTERLHQMAWACTVISLCLLLLTLRMPRKAGVQSKGLE